MFSFAVVVAALASLAAASPALPLESRALPSGSVTCGSNVYTVSQVSAAVSAGYSHVGSPLGSSACFDYKLLVQLLTNMWLQTATHTHITRMRTSTLRFTAAAAAGTSTRSSRAGHTPGVHLARTASSSTLVARTALWSHTLMLVATTLSLRARYVLRSLVG